MAIFHARAAIARERSILISVYLDSIPIIESRVSIVIERTMFPFIKEI